MNGGMKQTGSVVNFLSNVNLLWLDGALEAKAQQKMWVKASEQVEMNDRWTNYFQMTSLVRQVTVVKIKVSQYEADEPVVRARKK